MVILLVVLFTGARFARADYDKRKELESYAKAAKQAAVWARWQPRVKKSGRAVHTAKSADAFKVSTPATAPGAHNSGVALKSPNSDAIVKMKASVK